MLTDGRRTDAGVTGILLALPWAFSSSIKTKTYYFYFQSWYNNGLHHPLIAILTPPWWSSAYNMHCKIQVDSSIKYLCLKSTKLVACAFWCFMFLSVMLGWFPIQDTTQWLHLVGRICNNFEQNRAFYVKSMKLGTWLVENNTNKLRVSATPKMSSNGRHLVVSKMAAFLNLCIIMSFLICKHNVFFS